MGAQRVREDLKGSVHLTNRLGQRVVLFAGQKVPDGFTLGEHLRQGGGADEAPVEAPATPDQELVAGNVGDVVARVGDDAEQAVAVLQAEHAVAKAEGREPRKGVVEPLQKLIDDTAGGS